MSAPGPQKIAELHDRLANHRPTEDGQTPPGILVSPTELEDLLTAAIERNDMATTTPPKSPTEILDEEVRVRDDATTATFKAIAAVASAMVATAATTRDARELETMSKALGYLATMDRMLEEHERITALVAKANKVVQDARVEVAALRSSRDPGVTNRDMQAALEAIRDLRRDVDVATDETRRARAETDAVKRELEEARRELRAKTR